MKFISMIKNRLHNDLLWRDYNGNRYVYDSINADQILSYVQNEYLINQIGLEEIKKTQFYKYVDSIHQMMELYSFLEEDIVLKRVGNDSDGGYVMAYPFSECKIAYSIGINEDVSWDNEMANNGYELYMYDHTIKGLPYSRSEFHWKRIGITGLAETNKLKRLDSIIEENGHENTKGMLLKMDVEGAEWEVINSVDIENLRQFDQIVVEMHGFLRKNQRDIILSALKKLSSCFRCAHIHANNFGRVEYIGDMIIGDVLETIWINERYNMVKAGKVVLPTELDRPCNHNKADIIMGIW